MHIAAQGVSVFLLKGRLVRALVACVVTASLVITTPALACTSFIIRATDNSVVYGRTMEFGMDMKSQVMVIPRGYALQAAYAKDGKSMAWKSQYAVVGMNALGQTSLVDGLNERGLAGGVLYFDGFARYADPARVSAEKKLLAPWDLLTWALTNYASVDEVKNALAGVAIVGVSQPAMGGEVPPVHYTLHDKAGKSIVIEPVNGELRVYDNPLGVLTNSPPFEWHMINLGNYVKLSAMEAPAQTLQGQVIAPLGQGSGLLGVPGDPTPPSRFVRAVGYTISAAKQAPGLPSVKLAEHIANSFDIPKGWIEAQEKGRKFMDYTQWTIIADLSSSRYYIKSYEDQTLRSVALADFDLNAKHIAYASLPKAADALAKLAFSLQAEN